MKGEAEQPRESKAKPTAPERELSFRTTCLLLASLVALTLVARLALQVLAGCASSVVAGAAVQLKLLCAAGSHGTAAPAGALPSPAHHHPVPRY